MIYDIEELLTKLKEKLVNYINDEKYVYKTCGSFIVVLEKLPDTITNENRSNVSQIGDDKLYAKYRADKLLVKQIINKNDLKKCNVVMSSCYEIKTEYKINENVYPDNFDTDLKKVCSSGIHYFLNLERAFYYCIKLENMNGEYLDWHDNGVLHKKCSWVDGKINGEYFRWYNDGQMYVKTNCINGMLNGEYFEWYSNGQIWIKCNYINGNKNGEYFGWYENGDLCINFNVSMEK